MAKKMKKLRAGLSVKDLLEGSALIKLLTPPLGFSHQTRYPDLDAIGFETVQFFCERLIQHVDAGNDVSRQAIIEGATTAAKMTMRARNLIVENMRNDKLLPSVLDELAAV